MKFFSSHRCQSQHRTSRTFARCAFPGALVSGPDTGAYLVVSHCAKTTVSLWTTDEEARSQRVELDANGCGAACTGEHTHGRVRHTYAAPLRNWSAGGYYVR